MLACLPSMVVVRVGSEETVSPFRLQVMDMGMSPLLMTQVSWAYFPWSMLSDPKVKGTISGGSVNRICSSANPSNYHSLIALQSEILFLQHSQPCTCRLHYGGSLLMILQAYWLECRAWWWSEWGQS